MWTTLTNGESYTNGTAVDVVLWKQIKRRNGMKEELMTEVMQQMLPYLDNEELKQLKIVMEQVLFHYDVTSVDIKSE